MADFQWKAWLKRGIKLALGAMILWMVGGHILRILEKLRASGHRLLIDPTWLSISLLLYVGGLAAFGLFFWRILACSATPVGLWAALRAYIISHLGKYVPGKALVVVLRVGLVRPAGARPATAAFATLYETLVMMASGGLIAAIVFAAAGSGGHIEIPVGGERSFRMPLAVLGLGLGGPLFVMAQARVFPRMSTLLRTPFKGVGPDALPRFSTRLLAEGMALSLVGWTLWGLSQVAVIRGIGLGVPGHPMELLDASHWPMVVGSVALATVAGFLVAIFPGGLIIREGVLMAALGATLGAEEAVVAALALRLAWVAAELLASAVSAFVRPAARPETGESEPLGFATERSGA